MFPNCIPSRNQTVGHLANSKVSSGLVFPLVDPFNLNSTLRVVTRPAASGLSTGSRLWPFSMRITVFTHGPGTLAESLHAIIRSAWHFCYTRRREDSGCNGVWRSSHSVEYKLTRLEWTRRLPNWPLCAAPYGLTLVPTSCSHGRSPQITVHQTTTIMVPGHHHKVARLRAGSSFKTAAAQTGTYTDSEKVMDHQILKKLDAVSSPVKSRWNCMVSNGKIRDRLRVSGMQPYDTVWFGIVWNAARCLWMPPGIVW
ncbi:hypothetical protein FB45DRAFT_873758 [Roridomyces roridus]|uniref:Uncharacterized protein n=1 Tax=Roridomyces roridus TaxID=1738132 RepID=A0AAD7FE58_9AGAR|nr:hypothetical protein FB45DRAFT_873758 [Roridomyces roridus]